jgi:hypothetical protein
MAILNLKDVTVARLNNSGNGFSVLEQNESKGKTYKTYFSIWATEPHGLSIGDVISLSGFLSAKVGDPWTGNDGQERRSVELGINSPRMDKESTTSGHTSPSNAITEPWATDTSSNLPTPQTGAQGHIGSEPWNLPDDASVPF